VIDPYRAFQNLHCICRGGCPHPPGGLQAASRRGSIGDRPLQGVSKSALHL